MAVFEAFHPNNETLGIAILAILEALDYTDIERILAQHGLAQIQPDAWYPQQSELNVMKQVLAEHGDASLIEMGKKIPDMVEYPLEINSIGAAFTFLNAGYAHNHRGKNIGYFRWKPTTNTSGVLEAHNPYPSDLDYGVVYRLVEIHRPTSSDTFAVKHLATAKNRKNGGDTCFYEIEW